MIMLCLHSPSYILGSDHTLKNPARAVSLLCKALFRKIQSQQDTKTFAKGLQVICGQNKAMNLRYSGREQGKEK